MGNMGEVWQRRENMENLETNTDANASAFNICSIKNEHSFPSRGCDPDGLTITTSFQTFYLQTGTGIQ